MTDRLGSVRANGSGQKFNYYPYGGEVGSETTEGRSKFGTYQRDSAGVDYAEQRYYTAGSGRFLTMDASSNVNPRNPGAWNRYAYAYGDPAKFYDPSGRTVEDPDCGPDWITDPSLSGPCDVDGGTGIGGGGGGGGSFVATRGPDPNWQTASQIAKNVALWDVLIAAALAKGQGTQQGGQPGYRYVAYLAVAGDCYQRQIFGGGSVVRVRTYQAIDEFGQPYADPNLTISEHNYVQSGSLSAYNSTWHVDNKGEFEDYLSRGSGPDTTEYQQFTASNSSGLNSFSNAPVMVYDPSNPNGPFFGTLGIVLRQHSVWINGSDATTNGKLNYCK